MNSIQYYLYGAVGLIIVFATTSLLAPLMPLIAVAVFCYIFYLTHQFIIDKDEHHTNNGNSENWFQEALAQEALEQEAKLQEDK